MKLSKLIISIGRNRFKRTQHRKGVSPTEIAKIHKQTRPRVHTCITTNESLFYFRVHSFAYKLCSKFKTSQQLLSCHETLLQRFLQVKEKFSTRFPLFERTLCNIHKLEHFGPFKQEEEKIIGRKESNKSQWNIGNGVLLFRWSFIKVF